MEEEMDQIRQRGGKKQGILSKQLKIMFITFPPFLCHPPYQDPAFSVSAWLLLVGWVRYSNVDNLLTKFCLIFWKHTAKDPGNYGSGAPRWMVEAVPCCCLRCVLAAGTLEKHSFLHHESPPGIKADRI